MSSQVSSLLKVQVRCGSSIEILKPASLTLWFCSDFKSTMITIWQLLPRYQQKLPSKSSRVESQAYDTQRRGSSIEILNLSSRILRFVVNSNIFWTSVTTSSKSTEAGFEVGSGQVKSRAYSIRVERPTASEILEPTSLTPSFCSETKFITDLLDN